jgi:hypothetical protein
MREDAPFVNSTYQRHLSAWLIRDPRLRAEGNGHTSFRVPPWTVPHKALARHVWPQLVQILRETQERVTKMAQGLYICAKAP